MNETPLNDVDHQRFESSRSTGSVHTNSDFHEKSKTKSKRAGSGKYRFSLLKLMGFTAFIAVVYAIPPKVCAMLSGFSFTTFICTALLLGVPKFNRAARASGKPNIEQALIDLLTQVVYYSGLLCAILIGAQLFRLVATSW